MPATGVSGIDLYARDERGKWRRELPSRASLLAKPSVFNEEPEGFLLPEVENKSNQTPAGTLFSSSS
jgi:hypothetical protein